jgi:predicted dehydrogenase
MVSISLALVGCGGMGRRHVFGLQKLNEALGQTAGANRIELVAAIDRDPARAAQLADEAERLLGRRPALFSDLDQALNSEVAECFDICTGSESHHALGLQVLENGVHLFIEKPLTSTILGATQLIEAAERTGRKLAVAENVRREPVNRYARALIEAGVIGEIRFVLDYSFSGGNSILLTPWRHLRHTGGPLLDVGVHTADVIEYLAGPVNSVSGRIALDEATRVRTTSPVKSASFYEPWEEELPASTVADAEDVAAAVLEFESGALGQWTIHQAAHGQSRSARVIYGSEGSIELPPDRAGGPLTLVTDSTRGRSQTVLPNYRLDPFEAAVWCDPALTHTTGDFAEIDRSLLAIEFHDLAQAISEDRKPEVDGRDGRRNMAMVYSVIESSLAMRPVAVRDVELGIVREYQMPIDQSFGLSPQIDMEVTT